MNQSSWDALGEQGYNDLEKWHILNGFPLGRYLPVPNYGEIKPDDIVLTWGGAWQLRQIKKKLRVWIMEFNIYAGKWHTVADLRKKGITIYRLCKSTE